MPKKHSAEGKFYPVCCKHPSYSKYVLHPISPHQSGLILLLKLNPLEKKRDQQSK